MIVLPGSADPRSFCDCFLFVEGKRLSGDSIVHPGGDFGGPREPVLFVDRDPVVVRTERASCSRGRESQLLPWTESQLLQWTERANCCSGLS